ncbi:MAG: efflux RND transporter periplasmic adaptor subunit [Caulobacteraceae bacterium]
MKPPSTPPLEGRRCPRGLASALATVSAIALAGMLAACSAKKPPPPPPPTVGVVRVEPQAVPLTTDLPGRTSPFEIADVRPQVSGVIQARLFTEGAIVRAGQIMYQIEPAPYRAAYDQALGTLANAKANLVTTRLKAGRYAELVKVHAVSTQDYDDAEAAYKQGAATVQQDAAAVEAAKINLNFTRVVSPIPGRSGISAVTKGALVTADQTTALTTVQRLNPIYVDIVQSAAQILALRQQMATGRLSGGNAEVRLTLDDGTTYPVPGKLQFTDITVDPSTGSVTLRAIFPNPDQLLLPGMFVNAKLIEGVDPNGILVPQQAVSRDPRGRATADIVDSAGRVEMRSLTLGQTVGNRWLVTSGLNPGDEVIVEGLLNVHPGQAVRTVTADIPNP